MLCNKGQAADKDVTGGQHAARGDAQHGVRGRAGRMIRELALLPDARTIRRLDVLSVVIVIGFAAFGLFAGLHLWGLAGLHRGLLGAAAGLESTGRAQQRA